MGRGGSPDHASLLSSPAIATDTAAYATGRLFGSHKITPRLSPNKTLEGMIGGFVIGTMAFWFAWVAFHPQTEVLRAP